MTSTSEAERCVKCGGTGVDDIVFEVTGETAKCVACDGTGRDRWTVLRRLGAARQHEVQIGDTLSSIAKGTGFSWRELYEHPFNRFLRVSRPNPNIILAGDVVFIPTPR